MNNIREIRTSKGVTRQQLADAIGVTVNAIQNYEVGYRDPRLSIAIKIAKTLNVTLDELFIKGE